MSTIAVKIAQLLKIGQPQAALDLLDAELSPDEPEIEALYWRGRSLLALKRYDEAANALLSLLKQDPTHFQAVIWLGDVFFHAGLWGASMACASRAIELSPDHIPSYRNLIALYQYSTRKNNAERIVRGAKTDAPARSARDATVIVLCGGEASRWKAHLGTPQKHLIRVEGEVLLDRTLRQLEAHGPARTIVMVRLGDREIYGAVCGMRAEVVEVETQHNGETQAWKYLSSQAHWNPGGVTVSLLGDVWFSDAAMSTIFAPHASAWLAFGRPSASAITGCPYGEIFAHKFTDLLSAGQQTHLRVISGLRFEVPRTCLRGRRAARALCAAGR